MTRAKLFRSILIGPTILSTSPALAQTPTILDQITITSTKTEQSTIDVLSGSSVIPRSILDDIQPDEIQDIFDGVPGVEGQDNGSDPGTAINIRGLQDFGRVNVLVESARQDFSRSGHGPSGTFFLDPELIKRVDITRGPVATIFGSGAIGGVVNFELKDATDILEPNETIGAQVKSSYNTNDEGFLTSGTLAFQQENFDILGNLVWRDKDNYSDGDGREIINTAEHAISGHVKARFRPTEGNQISFVASQNNTSYQTGATDVFPGDSLANADTRATNVIGTWEYESPDNPMIDFTGSLYYTNTLTEQTRLVESTVLVFPPFGPPVNQVVVPVGSQRSFEIDTYGFNLFNTSRFDLGEASHQLTFGADGFRDSVTTIDPHGTGNEFTPSGERSVIGAFVQDQINYQDWLEIIAALRFDSFDLSGGNLSLQDTNLAPKITVGVTPFEGLQLFATYSEAFRAPAITEVFNNGLHSPGFPFEFRPNPDLNPEVARNYEFGANIKYDGVFHSTDKLRAKVVYFNNNIENYIEGQLTGTNPATCFNPALRTGCGNFQYVNVPDARIYGLEVEASYDIENFFSRFAYSRIRGENANTGAFLSTVDPDKFSVTAGFKLFEEKVTVGGRFTSVAKQDRAPDSIIGAVGDAHQLVDLFASYEPNSKTRFSVSLNNITDEQYTEYNSLNAGEGFSAMFTATFKIGG